MKAALTSAEVESPIDMEHIKLALQGYNFGNGYISWAKTNYGGYSYANAVEFSTMQASRLGWSSYGDTQYVAHVLRYYPYGRAFTAGGNQAIVEVALTQLGKQAQNALKQGKSGATSLTSAGANVTSSVNTALDQVSGAFDQIGRAHV